VLCPLSNYVLSRQYGELGSQRARRFHLIYPVASARASARNSASYDAGYICAGLALLLRTLDKLGNQIRHTVTFLRYAKPLRRQVLLPKNLNSLTRQMGHLRACAYSGRCHRRRDIIQLHSTAGRLPKFDTRLNHVLRLEADLSSAGGRRRDQPAVVLNPRCAQSAASDTLMIATVFPSVTSIV